MDTKKLMTEALKCGLEGRPFKVPIGHSVLWAAFARLSERRGGNGSGPNPIAFSEMRAYANLMCMPLEPHHVDVIAAMDDVWLRHVYSKMGTPVEDGAPNLPPRSSAALTPTLFDLTNI